MIGKWTSGNQSRTSPFSGKLWTLNIIIWKGEKKQKIYDYLYSISSSSEVSSGARARTPAESRDSRGIQSRQEVVYEKGNGIHKKT